MPSRTYKFRGSRTHGRGFKSGRGAGLRGGRGNAGLHKHKMKSMVIYAPDHFGRHGFKRPPEQVHIEKAINIMTIDEKMNNWVEKGKAKLDNGTLIVNLTELGYEKLLSKGMPSIPMQITVKNATKNAIKKVESSKGKVSIASKGKE
ncbi:MAG: 50S ribosomal protein L15 [Candidatus Thermoplasmatota archaeon]|jgi:large subunit ribosomal protein L15|nr:50S ribosomal protein L15 [Candidatus Thermoplasmatota archaeon]MCL5962985.1 50S ribosomal protein L15 [Candidatus Thermoplasmatota archaeon]